jgi:S-adenosylmethionine:tRNA ribosyltransferase-isomerase
MLPIRVGIELNCVRVSDFHFDLPEELIAQHPPVERGSSRMLVVDRGTGALKDAMFSDLPGLLEPGDLLVLNDSRVLPARLFGVRVGLGTQASSPRPSGAVEVLLTEEVEEQGTEDREQGTGLVWRVLVKPAKKVRVGETLLFFGPVNEPNTGILRSAQNDKIRSSVPDLVAEVVGAGEFGERTLRFDPVEDFYGVLGRIGHMPLPPYIRREQAREMDSEEDRERYQTVYAQASGSAAAPTAGLHFTSEVLAALAARGVEIAYVTLHVGLGTFQPVRVEELKDIRLHAERYTLSAATADALNRALAEGRRVVAVGTTTTRTLEHIAAEADLAHGGRVVAHSGSTSIFIGPGHRFLVVGGLLTNFHLPESTLLMLVSALAGRETVLAAYEHAVRERYRFYSYGDCMLVV